MNSNLTNSSVREFFSAFTAWFDADLIDITDSVQVENAIAACAFDTLHKPGDVRVVVSYLEGVLADWSGHQITPFINATCLDWLEDEETLHTLRFVLQSIVAALKESAIFIQSWSS